ncbi:hypothetical protein [Paenibacillus sp. Y412MC10]|uniref:hypothetical protein n=1 Tax=Geobacillus sp. (strain Y412MC10) TaxID=481743 RepID=UPI0011A5B87B|nr:hypothetical protein [Paenibacillus sp. Y412MC10]
MDSNTSKAESIAQAAKDLYDELRKVFDEDTAKELLIASMLAICTDVTSHVYIPSLSLGGMSDKPEVWGDTEREMIIPLSDLERKEPGWIGKCFNDALKKAMTKRNLSHDSKR